MANQTWDPLSYGKNGAFVHVLASGVLEWLAAKPNERILDLGCGDGQTSKRIAANGATVMGVHAVEIIHEVGVAISDGLTIDELGDIIHAHPTVSENIMDAAEQGAGVAPYLS